MRLGKLLLKDGYIYMHGRDMNLARLDRPWPFAAQVAGPDYGQWEDAEAVFPGSYIQAVHLRHRIKDTDAARAFLRPSLLKQAVFALKGFGGEE